MGYFLPASFERSTFLAVMLSCAHQSIFSDFQEAVNLEKHLLFFVTNSIRKYGGVLLTEPTSRHSKLEFAAKPLCSLNNSIEEHKMFKKSSGLTASLLKFSGGSCQLPARRVPFLVPSPVVLAVSVTPYTS